MFQLLKACRDQLQSLFPRKKILARKLRIDPLEERFVLAFGVPTLNISGQGFSGVLPPDTVGDVGVYNYVQATNASSGAVVTVYNKSNGSIAVPQFAMETLAPNGTAGASGNGDPIVVYDQLADRWMLMEFSATSNALCFYISDTGIPTSNPADWTYWQLDTTNFPDYPKVTVWNNAYFIGCNEGDNPVYALDRNLMLTGAGGSITAIRRTTPARPNWQRNHIMPADIEGFNLAPNGSPGIFARQVDDEYTNPGGANPANDFIELWEFQPNFALPASSTYTLAATIPIADFDYIVGNDTLRTDLEQLGSSQLLDALPHYMMWRLTYRNWGGFESLVGNFTSDVNEDGTPDGTGGTATEQAGFRWFELRRTGGGAWSVYQQADYKPDTNHRWMASAAMNGDGDIAVGHSVTSATMFPSIGYAGRRAADTLGTLSSGPFLMHAGTSPQTSTAARWGDYAALNVDPVDDATFWFTTEFGTGNNWGTRIGSFAFDDPDVTIYGTVDDDAITLRRNGANVEVLIDGIVVRTMAIVGLNSLVINGQSGNDTLTIDYTGGNPIPTGGITYNGGNPAFAPGDKLVINGGSFTTATFQHSTSSDGSVNLDGAVINYTGLEPVETQNTSITNLVVNLPDTDDATDDVTALGIVSGRLSVDSVNGEHEDDLISLTGVTNLTVNGRQGDDTITLLATMADYTSNLTINGGAQTDTIQVSAALAMTSGTLSITGESIFLGAATLSTSARSVQLNGNVVLQNNVTINSQGGSIDLSGASVSSNLAGPWNLALSSSAATAGSLLLGTFNSSGGTSVRDLSLTAQGNTLALNGDMTLTGPVTLASGGNLTASARNLTLSTVNSDVLLSGTGAIALDASQASLLDGSSLTTANRNITLAVDALNLFTASATIQAGSGTVALRSRTVGQQIDVGGMDSAGVLGLSEPELDRIFAGTIELGSTSSGLLSISADVTRTGAIRFVSGAGLRSTTGSVTTDGTVTLDAKNPASARFAHAGVDYALGGGIGLFALAAGTRLEFAFNGPLVDSGYEQLRVAGQVNLTGATLVVSGSFSGSSGQSFTIIDSSAPILGNFAGLNEGDTVLVGSTVYRITYAGGDGFDVVLTTGTTVQFATASLSLPEANTATTVLVTLSEPYGSDVVVPLNLSGSASSGSDYTLSPSTSLTILAGQTSVGLALTLFEDLLLESDETITIALGTPNGVYLGAVTSHTVTILDDDSPPVAQFVLTAQTVSEAITVSTLEVRLSHGFDQDVTIPFSRSGTAASVSDYTLSPSAVLVIPAGQTSGTIQVSLVNDGVDEGNETIILTLGAPINAVLGAVSSHAFTILDDDPSPTVQFVVASQSANESASSTTVRVSLSTISALDVTVPIAITGNALSGSDFTLTPISLLTIPAGQTSGTINVTILDDLRDEIDESVTLTFGTPDNATLGSISSHTLTIVDNDTAAVQFTFDSQSVGEAASQAVLRVVVSQLSDFDITVPFTLSGSATLGTDFSVAPPATLTIPAGFTSGAITVTIVNDIRDEFDETVVVTLGTPTNAVLNSTLVHTLTILDDDVPAVQFATNALTTQEIATPTQIRVISTILSDFVLTVPFSLGGIATLGVDFALSPVSSVTILPGQTSAAITVTPISDPRFEGNETVIATLGTPTNAVLGAVTVNTLTILDNDPPPLVQFTSISQNVSESANSTRAIVRLGAVAGLDVTVPITVSGSANTTGPNADGTIVSTMPVVIPAGQTSAAIDMTLVDDALAESTETIVLTIGNPTNGTRGAVNTHTLSILDNDTSLTVQFAAGSVNVGEAIGSFPVIVTLSSIALNDVSVPLTFSGSASSGDYLPSETIITIPAGETRGIFTIRTTDDQLDELAETIVVSLGAPSGVSLGGVTSSTITIDDNDPVVSFSKGADVTTDTASTIIVYAQVMSPVVEAISIPFAFFGNATSPSDYTLSATQFNFAIGDSTAAITISVAGDGVIEPAEFVSLRLTPPTNASLGGNSQYTLFINDADTLATPGLDLNGSAPGQDFMSPAAEYLEDASAATLVPNATVVTPGAQTLSSISAYLESAPNGTSESLAATNFGGATVTPYNTATRTLTISGGSTSDKQTVLRSLAYQNTSQNPTAGGRFVSITAAFSGGSDVRRRKLVVTPQNDSPVTTLASGSTSYVTGSAAVKIDGEATIADVDSSYLTSVVVTITDAESGDLLSYTPRPGLSYTLAGNAISIGGLASPEYYVGALQLVRFSTSAVGDGARSVSIAATDFSGVTGVPNATATVTKSLTVQSPLLLAETSVITVAVQEHLIASQLQPLVTEAFARWKSAGLGESQLAILRLTTIEIHDLNDSRTLGLGGGSSIVLDDNAAGVGWFIDNTPTTDDDVTLVDRVDLLTVLMHEYGHILGLDDIAGDPVGSVMSESLSTGVRRVPTVAALNTYYDRLGS